MDYGVFIFWFVVVSCLSGLVGVARRARSVGRGWMVLFLVILVVAVFGRLTARNGFVYVGLAMWVLLVLCPGLLSRLYFQRFLQQRYTAARRLATLVSWLHPADGWSQQVKIIHALELAQQGELAAAAEALKRYQGGKSFMSLAGIMNLYRLTNQWEELLAWQTQHLQKLEPHPQLLPILLRAHGENGDLRGMVEMYRRNKDRIARLTPAASRDLCRLVLFAFCGERTWTERLFAGSLSILPAPTQSFWLATADLASGASDSAKRQLEQLLPVVEPSLRQAIERRLSRSRIRPQPLDAAEKSVLEEAAREQAHDQSFGAQPSLFSKQARATQLIIALNLVIFGVEIFFGGSTNPETLFRLGALFPPAIRAGELWRLATSLFLHFGPLHLAMNMFGLWLLGPFVEFALGFRRFLLVYLFAGIGSMYIVTMFGTGPNGDHITVGASGCIMGLVGATGALMLRGWLREKALSAKRRLWVMLVIVATQTIFDAVVPQVSMTGHLSGVAIGFAVTLILRDKLRGGAVLKSV